MKRLMIAATVSMLTLAATGITGIQPVKAEQVKVPVMNQADREALALPRTGQSRAAVRQQFGDPKSISAPVGNPPITQWHYEAFVVYFEYDHVIHSVAKRSP